jgi:hypothetical protein
VARGQTRGDTSKHAARAATLRTQQAHKRLQSSCFHDNSLVLRCNVTTSGNALYTCTLSQCVCTVKGEIADSANRLLLQK